MEQEQDPLVDPITLQPMVDAVITPCGHSFSEVALLAWLRTSSRCPTCRQQGVTPDSLRPNYALRSASAAPAGPAAPQGPDPLARLRELAASASAAAAAQPVHVAVLCAVVAHALCLVCALPWLLADEHYAATLLARALLRCLRAGAGLAASPVRVVLALVGVVDSVLLVALSLAAAAVSLALALECAAAGLLAWAVAAELCVLVPGAVRFALGHALVAGLLYCCAVCAPAHAKQRAAALLAGALQRAAAAARGAGSLRAAAASVAASPKASVCAGLGALYAAGHLVEFAWRCAQEPE
eukprot:m51a1_g12409 hypothetical protein (298) ;mRNA; r:710787-711680